MKCPICDAPLTSGEVCKTCGFDSSCDYERYGSLVLSLKKSPSLAARREVWRQIQAARQKAAEAQKIAPPKRVYYVGEDGRWYDREEPAETPPAPTPPASEPEEYAPSRLPKLLICGIAALFAVIAIIILVYAIHAWRTTEAETAAANQPQVLAEEADGTIETETAAANQPQVLAEKADGTICIGVYDIPSQSGSTTDSAWSDAKTVTTYANELHPQVQMGDQVMDVELVFASDMEGDFTLDENGEPADDSYSTAAANYFKEQQCSAVLCCYDSYAADFMSLLSSAGIPVLVVETRISNAEQGQESVFSIDYGISYSEAGNHALQFAADELGAESVTFLCQGDEYGGVYAAEELETWEDCAAELGLSYQVLVATESSAKELEALSGLAAYDVIFLDIYDKDDLSYDLEGVQSVLDEYGCDAAVLLPFWRADTDDLWANVYYRFRPWNLAAWYNSDNPLYPVYQELETRCGNGLGYKLAFFDAYQLLLDALSQCDDPADFGASYIQNASLSADEALAAAAHFNSDRELVYTSCCYYNNGAWRTYDFSETRG